MSQSLLQFAKDFVAGKISAEQFADPYQAKWKAERDSGALSKDPSALNEKLSTLFCLADQYNPETDRHYSEFDAEELKKRVKNLLES
ncbi:colicin immunity domain-containing protein [Pantoea sp. LMR881]|uniref:colicin immunity domain-containing protein n=1 Tax=Pantoea sp. LMR881 TaxID=3014336 RepID=UPI0022B0696B|nr:colicin immunity domain-containing protein [Pantoea sp. LMR881]MCZ4061272.1 colicin immunity domain-containing protein [Pantoea sp. LMR881]